MLNLNGISPLINIIEEISWEFVLKNCNSGNYNSGYRNSGDYNSGDYNSGDYNSAMFSFLNFTSSI